MKRDNQANFCLRCVMAMTRRNLIVLGVAPNEFLIRAEGDEAAVREGLQRLLPSASFQLEAVTERRARQLESRLSDGQLKAAKKLSGEAGVRGTRRLATYRMSFSDPSTQVVATATASGVLKFNPNISEVRKPLGGGVGPVGVTVGVGIAGKF
jgi:hypothetical protein